MQPVSQISNIYESNIAYRNKILMLSFPTATWCTGKLYFVQTHNSDLELANLNTTYWWKKVGRYFATNFLATSLKLNNLEENRITGLPYVNFKLITAKIKLVAHFGKVSFSPIF